MSQFVFFILLFLAQLIRGPVSLILIILKNFSPALKKRIDFERKNILFHQDLYKADYCFEVSSEGELEQVRPLMENYLTHGKNVEILFSSPSVESKCEKLAAGYPEQVRIFRMPLATHAFILSQTAAQFISAPVLLFCRYDFFPELLIMKFFGKKFVLLNATAGKKPGWFKTQVFKLFDVIVAANEFEAEKFIKREHIAAEKVFSFDFRVPRIFERTEGASRVLSNVPALKNYLQFLDNHPRNERLILGSAWESDLVIFSPEWSADLKNGSLHLLVVPHDLSHTTLGSMKQELNRIFPDVPVYEISGNKSDWTPEKPGIVLLNLRGILCELYTHFDLVYIGGGFGRSIHSVLEPFLSGAKVFCGPRVHRSTEYDFVSQYAPDEIQLLNSHDSFYTLFKEKAATPPKLTLRDEIKISCKDKMKVVLESIK
jgi:3-deoxy-D-manno-octulosonic-acid transferase